jgi:hypothetical protein
VIAYFDTSALLKLIIAEKGADQANPAVAAGERGRGVPPGLA